MIMNINFESLFTQAPYSAVIFDISPDFNILNATDKYFKEIGRKRETIMGLSLIEAFPDGPNGWNKDARNALITSFKDVLLSGRENRMPIVRYDVPLENNEVEITYWSPENHPIKDDKGDITHIFHVAINMTRLMKL